MGGRLFQNIHVVNALPAEDDAEDLFATSVSTDIVNLSKYDKALFLLQRGAGATGAGVITVLSSSTAAGGTQTAIPFSYWVAASGDTWGDMLTATAAGYTTATAANGSMVAVEINSSELYSTDKFVQLVVTESTNDPVTGWITCIMGDARYMHEVKETAIV